MDVECHRIRLKPDALPLVREWAAQLNAEIKVVKELLRREGMALESVFLEEGLDGDFLVYYLRSPNLEKARKISRASQHPLDVFHRDIMSKVIADGKKLTCLLDAAADD